MKCPNCNSEMKSQGENESHNPKNGTLYKRVFSEGESCGTWVTTETPVKKNA